MHARLLRGLPRDRRGRPPGVRHPGRFPGADEVVVMWPHRFLETAPVDAHTVMAVLTHDEKFDIPLLERALRSDASYVGAMGSRAPTSAASPCCGRGA
ncbi:hypothetical protein GS575_04375 [Rhodococcus hoagii]|nr:hypothetical protein [Prescottella equi]